MATFIRVKGLKDGDVIEKPMTMTIPDEKMHLYQNCSWHGKWVQILEEKQEDKISVKSRLVDVPNVQVKSINVEVLRTEPKKDILTVSDLEPELKPDLQPKKRGRKPKA